MCVDRYMPPGKSLSINSSSAINVLHYIVQSSLFTTVDHGRIYRRRQSDATTSLVLRRPVHAIACSLFCGAIGPCAAEQRTHNINDP